MSLSQPARRVESPNDLGAVFPIVPVPHHLLCAVLQKRIRVIGLVLFHVWSLLVEQAAHALVTKEVERADGKDLSNAYSRKGEIRLSYGCPKTGAHQYKIRRL